ncbi:MAG TPA: LapA family protein [bacterium]|nr:LapA family protein [bacterium]
MFRTVTLVALFTTLLITVLLFALKNGRPVPVDLVVTRLDTVPLWVVMVAACAVGSTLATLVFAVVFFSLYFAKRSVEKELQKTRAELAALTVKDHADKGVAR